MAIRPGTLPASATGGIAIAVGVVYVSIIASQGPREDCSLCEPGVQFITGCTFGGGVLAVASSLVARGRGYVLGAAAGMMTFIALIVLVSSLMLIAGLPMLLATGLAIRATVVATRDGDTNKATTFAVALLTFVAGVGGEFATIALR